MDFVNFKDHLQELLDEISTDTFKVSSIRNMDGDSTKEEVIFTPLAGSVFKNSATIPYQIDIYTKSPDEVTNIFTRLAKERNNESFISIIEEGGETKEYTVFEFYSTAGVAEKQVSFGTNEFTHLVLFVTLNVLFEVGNVSKIEIDGEKIEFLNGTLSYIAETFSKRTTGQNLNKAKRIASTTGLSFTMVNKTSVFTNTLINMMFGKTKSQVFIVKVTLTNGLKGTMPMICNQNIFNFVQNTANLPSLNISLTYSEQ